MGPSTSISNLIASGNNVYVLWNAQGKNATSHNVFLKISNNGGKSFGSTINLTDKLGIHPYDIYSKTDVASDGHTLYVAWSDWNNRRENSNVFISKSTDQGNTFSPPLTLKNGTGLSGVVQLTTSKNNVYVLISNFTNSAYSDLLFRESNNEGSTFGKIVSLSTNHRFVDREVQMIISGNMGQKIYIAEDGQYWGSEKGGIFLISNNNGGSTFDHVTIANDTQEFTPQIAVSGNNIYMVWMEMTGQNTNIFFKKSVDGGTTFGDNLKLNKQSGSVGSPQLVVTKNNGNDIIYVKWTQSLSSGGYKLYLATSSDLGNTFSNPFDLGGFTEGFDFSQIGMLGNGTLYATWIGQYPSYSHFGFFFRTSTDYGTTFGDIFDLNAGGNVAILNPRIISYENHLYVAGDPGTAGSSDIIFRTSNDSGITFTNPVNLNTNEPLNASSEASQLPPIPQFPPDIPTSEPPNSQFSNSQNASFVLGQPDFVSRSASPTAGKFSNPNFVTFDSQGNFWVSDGGNDRVLEFKPPFVIGGQASVVLGQPDFTSWQVLNGTNPKSLYHPEGLAFDSQGNLWIADTNNNRVLEFKPPFATGQEPSLVLGHQDFTSGQPPKTYTLNSMYMPGGIAFDPSGNLWVADFNHRLLQFKPPFSNGQNASLILGMVNPTNDQQIGASTVWEPMGITFDSQGNLWVSDPGMYRILRFDAPFSNGEAATLVLGHREFLSGSDSAITNATSLRVPYGIALDSQRNLWVADYENNRVLEYTYPFSNGQRASLILGQISFNADFVNGAGHTAGSLNYPYGITFDKNRNLWVADSGNNRILVYKSRQAESNPNVNPQIIFPNPSELVNLQIGLTSNGNSNSPDAYQLAVEKMMNCSKRLGIQSDNSTAIKLAEDSAEFKSKSQGFEYKSLGISNALQGCKLSGITAVFSLSKNGTYVKSLYVSEDLTLTKVLNVTEQTGGFYSGASSMGQTVPEFPYATPILLVSIMSSIAFYRIVIKK